MNRMITAALALLLAASAAATAEKKSSAPAVADVDILALDMKMARFLARHVQSGLDPESRMHDLTDAIFSRKGLGIKYDDRETKTAAETFRTKSGNCLSFTIMYVAMARHLGLDAYFQEVGQVLSWDRRGDLVLSNQHMYVEVEIENGHLQVDFLPGAEKRYRLVRRISDARALAHYYNNLGVESLAGGDLDLALAYFEKALAADESFVRAWTNQGVAHRHLGDFESAERSHLRALEIDADNDAAATNLASLYLAAGRREEAQPLLARVEEHLRKNPFHHFRLGRVSARQGDTEAAIPHFRAAIRRRPDESEFHAALGEAYAATGDAAKARESLERALELAEDEAQRTRVRMILTGLKTHTTKG